MQQVRFAELLDQKLERAEVIIFNLLRKARCDIQLELVVGVLLKISYRLQRYQVEF